MARGGLIESGNIDISKLPSIRNPDGSYSTVRSIGIEMNGKYYLIPTVINGRIVSDEEAINSFEKTGKHLGVFSNQEASDAYAESLSNAYAERLKKMKEKKARGGPVRYSPREEALLRKYAN